MNNPVEIEDYQALLEETKRICRNDGDADGREDKPYNKEWAKGCDEAFGDYREAYEFGCQTLYTESECALRIEGEDNYCPWHPDIAACVEFLHNATNKGQGQASTDATCAQSFVTCLQESNPEKYCLNTNNTVFCKTIGDLWCRWFSRAWVSILQTKLIKNLFF